MTPRLRRQLVAGVLLGALVLVTTAALARPGGGGSFSGGGGGGGSGGGGGGSGGSGDGGAIVELLLWLCIEHPVIGIPLTIVVLGVFIWKKWSQSKQKDWSTGADDDDAYGIPSYQPPVHVAPVTASLDQIRQIDERFSRVIFEDFLYSLYAEVHRARGMNQLDRVSAYLSPMSAQWLRQSTQGPVESVIVGAMRWLEVHASAEAGSRVLVEFESNYTEAGRGWYVVERWTLTRRAGAKSRTPDRVRVLGCPGCGAPQEALFGGTCKHCSRTVNDGAFDLTVANVNVVTREQRPPILTANVQEQGTNLATVRDPELPTRIGALRQKDPAFDVGAFNARVGLVFQQFQIAWSGRNLVPMRPFLSDALFTTQQYWIQAYLGQRLRNVTDGARITNLELVKVGSDAFYDTITVRLFATGLDYTVSDDGKLVSGSRSVPRAYSEYWTLIRGTNRRGPTRTDLACSNCGAPLDVAMTGHCKYCRQKVTTGDFDWVLSRIEQDEVYAG